MPTLRELTEYHKPTTIDEAVKLLRRRKIHTRPIGGGTALVAEASPDVQAVVDLSQLGLSYVKTSEVSENLRGLEIGATTTLQALIDDAHVQAYADGVLVKAILDTASRNTREAATFAGSIVASDGKSPLLATLFALGAQLTIRGARSAREQTVPLEEFSPQADTLILSVTLPALPADAHAAYEKVARTPADLPIVCVAALKSADVTRLALGGVGDQMVVIDADAPTIDEAVELAQASIDPPTDYFASSDYRREMIGVLVKRVLA
ncbi:MAG: FAD binding domain-containing protein [Chloroflexi bacterium]|nr:FAD binding domain-containing protein [Chloroflexota bacterium]